MYSPKEFQIRESHVLSSLNSYNCPLQDGYFSGGLLEDLENGRGGAGLVCILILCCSKHLHLLWDSGILDLMLDLTIPLDTNYQGSRFKWSPFEIVWHLVCIITNPVCDARQCIY